MNNLTIIIPLLNEDKHLKSFLNIIDTYPNGMKFLFCDCGSTDNTLNILKSLNTAKNIDIYTEKVPNPSISKTISIAKQHITTPFCMIHPIDANCSSALKDIDTILKKDLSYILFYKKYVPNHYLLRLQEFLLNNIRVKIFKSFVWTNCPIFKTEIYKEILQFNEGFLEDVLISDFLKKTYSPYISKQHVLISSRKYFKDGHNKRFLGNALIMLLFRFKLKSVKDLKKMYYGK
jgi:glycosyltransferase involved in cell wall biosynthesis